MTINKTFVIYLSFVLISVFSLHGENTISLLYADNPAARYFYADSTISNFSLGYFSDKGADTYISEIGDAITAFDVYAGSFYIMDTKTRLSGYASYRNSTRRNSIWNENADYELIYPYVSGDSIGGDIYSEQYKFAGAYSRLNGSWVTGAELKYRAQIEHRTVDPRPRNIVSDMDLTFGAGYKSSRYLLSVRAMLNSYNQKSSIAFMSDLGSTSIYHMTGLGMDYIRFAGSNTSVNYKGAGYGAGIDLIREDRCGWRFSFIYSSRNIDKIMTSLNYLTLNELTIDIIHSQLSYTSEKSDKFEYGITLDAAYIDRKGIDNIFGNPTSNSYPLITSKSTYINQISNIDIKSVLKIITRNSSIIFSPSAGINDYNEKHIGSGREIYAMNMTGGCDFRILIPCDKVLFDIKAGYNCSSSLSSMVNLGGLEQSSSRYIALMRNYNHRTDNFNQLTLNVCCNINIKNKTKLNLSGGICNKNYSLSGNSTSFGITTGIQF